MFLGVSFSDSESVRYVYSAEYCDDPAEPALDELPLSLSQSLSPLELMLTLNAGSAGFGLASGFFGQARLGRGGGGAFPVLLDVLFLDEPAYPDLPGVPPRRRSLI